VNISGITLQSTVNNLLDALSNQVAGATFTLVDGEIQVLRDRYGNGELYNVRLTEGESADILDRLLGSNEILADDGQDSTLQVTDNFTAWDGTVFAPRQLEMSAMDPSTGQVTNILDLGDGGVTIYAMNGFQAGTAVINTERTEHTTAINVFDGQGTAYPLTVTFTKAGEANAWRFSVSVPEPAEVLSGATGTVYFDADNGAFASLQYDGNATGLTLDPGSGEQLNIAFNAGTPGLFDGITQTTAPTTTIAATQDGYAMGTLESIDIDGDGVIHGNYSNGTSNVLAQVLLARFQNNQGLELLGESLFGATGNSGTPVVGKAGVNFDTSINSGYLEMSNIDLAQEFADMIIAQRGFQANSKVITTSDALLDEVIRMKG